MIFCKWLECVSAGTGVRGQVLIHAQWTMYAGDGTAATPHPFHCSRRARITALMATILTWQCENLLASRPAYMLLTGCGTMTQACRYGGTLCASVFNAHLHVGFSKPITIEYSRPFIIDQCATMTIHTGCNIPTRPTTPGAWWCWRHPTAWHAVGQTWGRSGSAGWLPSSNVCVAASPQRRQRTPDPGLGSDRTWW